MYHIAVMKKILFIVLALSSVGVVLLSVTLFAQRQPEPKNPLSNLEGSAAEDAEEKLKQFKDPSGFSFSYPTDFTVETVTTVPSSVYSSLVVSPSTEKDSSDKMTIVVEDTSFASLSDWFTKNKLDRKKMSVKTLKLGGLDALQFENNDVLTTLALDKNVLFTLAVDVQENKKTWKDLNDKIIKTFTFGPPQEVGADSSSGSEEDIIYEGEEVIE